MRCKGEQKKRIFWRVNCENLLIKFQLSKAKHMKWKHRSKVKHEKYNKWKLRARLVHDANLELEEQINFLNQRILDLQNNNPHQNNNQHTGMAGYAPPKFCGLAGEQFLLRTQKIIPNERRVFKPVRIKINIWPSFFFAQQSLA